jgi:hypothetical protein
VQLLGASRRQAIFQIYVKMFRVNPVEARVGIQGSPSGGFLMDKLAAATVYLRVLRFSTVVNSTSPMHTIYRGHAVK